MIALIVAISLATSPVLPNAALTPGSINPAVTQANIQQTICKANFTSTIRPPASYTTKLKLKQLAAGYAINKDMNPASYEEDHLISLEIGGNPTDPKNLWPQPYAGIGARIKDQVENKLHALVCAGTMPLATAQKLIATNWWSAYKTYVASSK
jgi:hypothetical protein